MIRSVTYWARVVARRDALHLQRLEPVFRRVIIVDGRRRDHRAVAQAIGGRRIFRIVAEAGRVARLGEGNVPLVPVVGSEPDLIEAVDPLGDGEMVAEGGDAAQIDRVRSRDDRVPVAGMVGARLGDAEIDVIVIGQDPQLAVAGIDRILDVRGGGGAIRTGGASGLSAGTKRISFELFSPVEIRM